MDGTSDVAITREGDRTVLSVLHRGAPVITLRMTREQALTLAHDLIEETAKGLTKGQALELVARVRTHADEHIDGRSEETCFVIEEKP